jgi:hypothetical protein
MSEVQIGKWLSCDVMLIFVNNVPRMASLCHVHVNSVCLQDEDHLIDLGNMVCRRRLEPAHTLILASRVARPSETARLF